MVLQRILISSCRMLNKSISGQFTSLQKPHRFIHISACNFVDRLYTEKHEWIEIQGKIGIIGISEHAQESLGDIVYAQLPDAGTILKKDDECGALESVKAASEIYCPVSGKVTVKNNDVEDTPSLINKSCYDKGWLFKIELANDTDTKNLMTEKQYEEFLKTHE